MCYLVLIIPHKFQWVWVGATLSKKIKTDHRSCGARTFMSISHGALVESTVLARAMFDKCHSNPEADYIFSNMNANGDVGIKFGIAKKDTINFFWASRIIVKSHWRGRGKIQRGFGSFSFQNWAIGFFFVFTSKNAVERYHQYYHNQNWNEILRR